VARALALSFPDDRRVASIDDEYLLGDALLVAPILSPGSTGRAVYLPQGEWVDFWTGREHFGPADIPAMAGLDALPLYVRAGTVLPVGPAMQFTGEISPDGIELHLFPGYGESEMYEDDGKTLGYENGDYRATRFAMARTDSGIAIDRSSSGGFAAGYRRYSLVLKGVSTGAGAERPRLIVDGEDCLQAAVPRDDGLQLAEVGEFEHLEIVLQ
jgi:alpha-glucosidase